MSRLKKEKNFCIFSLILVSLSVILTLKRSGGSQYHGCALEGAGCFLFFRLFGHESKGTKMERTLSFTYHGCNEPDEFPDAVSICPNLHDLSDCELLLAIYIVTQILASRHGLEQALDMTQRTIYDHDFEIEWAEAEEDMFL